MFTVFLSFLITKYKNLSVIYLWQQYDLTMIRNKTKKPSAQLTILDYTWLFCQFRHNL